MKIALVIGRLDPLRGGAERSTVQFASGLIQRGHEVHVVARSFGDRIGPLPIVRHQEQINSRLGFARAAEARCRSLDLDIVHDMGAGWYCDIFQPRSGSVAAVKRLKLQLLPHWIRPLKLGFDRLTPRYGSLQTLTARQCVDDGRILIAMSNMVARHFAEMHGVGHERIRVIHNGVDPQQFSPEHREVHRSMVRRRLGIDDTTVMLLIVAHNFALKGVPTLFRAMERLTASRRPVHLVVVGGKRIGPWRRWARRLKIERSVTFTGPIEDTAPIYSAADVYVHPTVYDTCSRVVLEALAAGIPAVTSRFDGASELLTQGVDGFAVADPTDVDELLGCLDPLLDASVRERMGRAARRLALKHSFARVFDSIVDVYAEVIQSRRRAA